jgi:hypothetical protein
MAETMPDSVAIAVSGIVLGGALLLLLRGWRRR